MDDAPALKIRGSPLVCDVRQAYETAVRRRSYVHGGSAPGIHTAKRFPNARNLQAFPPDAIALCDCARVVLAPGKALASLQIAPGSLSLTHVRPAILFERLAVTALVLVSSACDHGFAPPDEPSTGVLVADITFSGHPGSWPPDRELEQLLFVAMRFVPRDTSDFLRLNLIEWSDPLRIHVPGDRILMDEVPTGPYLYAGVAQKYGPGAFDWRPVGLVEENGGVFVVAAGETSFVAVRVDFTNPPHFPPPAAN